VPEIIVETWLVWAIELDGRLVYVDAYPSWAVTDKTASRLCKRSGVLKAIVLKGAVVWEAG
jgi:hypothetical protein